MQGRAVSLFAVFTLIGFVVYSLLGNTVDLELFSVTSSFQMWLTGYISKFHGLFVLVNIS